MKTVSSGVLRVAGQGLMSLSRQDLSIIPSHRVKVATKVLNPLLEAIDEDYGKMVKHYGVEEAPGMFMVPQENRSALAKESAPLFAETKEIPDLKGITWKDLIDAEVRISAMAATALEEIGFLTGDPEPEMADA